MFHAANVEALGLDQWRVSTLQNGYNGYNARTVIDCPRDTNGQPVGLWAGHYALNYGDTGYNLLSQWLTDLYNDGYLNAASFQYILRDPQFTSHNEIRPGIEYGLEPHPNHERPDNRPFGAAPWYRIYRLERDPWNGHLSFLPSGQIPMPLSIDETYPRTAIPAGLRRPPTSSLPPPPPHWIQPPPSPPPPPPPPPPSPPPGAMEAVET